MERSFDDVAMLHFIRASLFRSDSPLHHEFFGFVRNVHRRAHRKSRKRVVSHVSLVIFTAVRRSLQILKPKLSNWNNASMHCRQQQQVLLQQLVSDPTICSPRQKMQPKLLQTNFDA